MITRRGIFQRIGIFSFLAVLVLGLTASAWCAEADYDGNYAGSYTGDETGYWVAAIDSAGDNVFLSYSPTADTGDTGTLVYWGEPNPGEGSFYTAATHIQGTEIDTIIDAADGSVSGTWDNVPSNQSGTLSGNQVTNSDYAGTASGSFAGDDTGSWSMTIDDNGYATGILNSDNYGASYFEGGCHPDGHILVSGENPSGWYTAAINISGSSLAGVWSAEDGSEGIIAGSIDLDSDSTAASSSSSSDGGSSGCFLGSLVSQ